jgi:hypothetical protein
VARAQVPVQAIVGSVERCADYTRGFLPLKDSHQARWTRVGRAFLRSVPLPTIQVGRVGRVCFSVDGHHRASVARQFGVSHLKARVLRVDADGHIEC